MARREEHRFSKRDQEEREKRLAAWVPRTALGRKVKRGEVESLAALLETNQPILEPEIVDYFGPLEEYIVDVKKTSYVVRAGRKFGMRVAVVVGNRDGVVGLGVGKDREKWPAARKAAQRARLNLFRVYRGDGAWESPGGGAHSLPFTVEGKSASVRVRLIPAPEGTGLVVGKNIRPVLELAGIQNVWSTTRGHTRTTLNFVRAALDALRQTARVKLNPAIARSLEAEAKAAGRGAR